MWLLIGLGSIVGGFVPSLFGADYLSLWGFLGSAVGAVAGIYLYNRLDI